MGNNKAVGTNRNHGKEGHSQPYGVVYAVIGVRVVACVFAIHLLVVLRGRLRLVAVVLIDDLDDVAGVVRRRRCRGGPQPAVDGGGEKGNDLV
jgi:hypothetical protein